MTYTPLATADQMYTLPLNDAIRDLTSDQQETLMIRASRAIESWCARRLTTFTVSESCRAQGIDPAESSDSYFPLDTQGMLGLSRAQSLGANELVRVFWLKEFPPLYSENWTGAITSIQIYRAIAGSQTLTSTNPASWQYESDTGHVRFNLGTYVPLGSTLVTTYTGGYTTVPDDLVQACLFKAAELALVQLLPESRPGVDLTELRQIWHELCGPYKRDS